MLTPLSLEVIGTFFGILYLIFEYRASVWLWPVSVVMPLIYIYIYYNAGIYADMGINVYYLVASIYGWAVWLRSSRRRAAKSQESQSDDIVHTSKQEWIWCSVAFVAFFALLAYILINFTPSEVPYCDSFTTALSIVAMWLLAHKRIEHWLVWLVVDIVSALLYFEKSLYPTAGLYGLYTLLAVGGYFRWRRLLR